MTGNVKQGETQRSWQTDSSRQCRPPPSLLSFHSLYLHLVEYYTKSYLLWARICVERVSTDFLPGLPRAAALNFILHTVKYHNTAQVPQQLHMLSTSPCIIAVLCPQSSHHTNPILVLIAIFDKRASFSASVHILQINVPYIYHKLLKYGAEKFFNCTFVSLFGQTGVRINTHLTVRLCDSAQRNLRLKDAEEGSFQWVQFCKHSPNFTAIIHPAAQREWEQAYAFCMQICVLFPKTCVSSHSINLLCVRF